MASFAKSITLFPSGFKPSVSVLFLIVGASASWAQTTDTSGTPPTQKSSAPAAKTSGAKPSSPAPDKSGKQPPSAVAPAPTDSSAAPTAVRIKGSIPLSEVNSQGTAPSGKTAEQLQEIVVEGVPIEQTTLPVLPSSSLYGFDTTVQDTPRQVSQITPRQFQEDTITSYDDFAEYAPGVTQAGSRATPAAPTIRGGVAEIYQNGIQKFNPGIGFPFEANAYESADIVSGPASVIYGPTQNSAGYVDYTTKQPFFDANHTTVNLNMGTWASGGQGGYPDFSQQIDNGGPIIKNELAYRISYQQQEADSYYDYVKNDYNDLYGALSWTPSFNKDFSADWNFDYTHYDYSQWNGTDRITQNLINNGTYITGQATPVIKEGTKYYVENPNGTFNVRSYNGNGNFNPTGTNVATIPGNSNTGAGAGSIVGWVLSPANARTQSIYGYEGDIQPQDLALADLFNTELRLHFHVDDDFTIENHSYFEYQWNKITSRGSNYYYYTTYDFENRTEFITKKDFDFLGLQVEDQANSGLDLRFESLDYANVTSVNGSPFDLTQSAYNDTLSQLYGGGTVIPAPNGIGTIKINGVTYYVKVTPTVAVPGAGGNIYASPGGTIAGSGTGTVDDQDTQIALYSQHNLKFDDQWGFNVGGRVTLINANYTNPLPDAEANSVAAGSYSNPGGDSTNQIIPAVSASLTYKPVDWTTLYLSYEYEQALNTSTTGQFTPSNGNQLGSSQFHSDSYLYEGGAKFTFIPNQLYGSIAGYYQSRALAPNPALGELAAQENVDGVDASLNYQPDKHFLVGANYSYIQAHYQAYDPSPAIWDPYGFEANGTTVFQVSPSSAAYPKLEQGNYRVSATPNNNFNAFAQYQLDNGLGVKAKLWVESDQNVNIYESNLRIPAQYQLDLAAFYAQPRYRGEVDFDNVTDQRNWETDIREAAGFLIEKPPFSISAKFSYYF